MDKQVSITGKNEIICKAKDFVCDEVFAEKIDKIGSTEDKNATSFNLDKRTSITDAKEINRKPIDAVEDGIVKKIDIMESTTDDIEFSCDIDNTDTKKNHFQSA